MNEDASILKAACDIAPEIAAAAEQTERDRRLPVEIVQTLVRARVFRLCIPGALDGAETSPATMVRVIETIARADGSAGWAVAIGATSGVSSAYLPLPTAREIYGPADAVTGGAFAPQGRAVVVDGGYRVSGRWPFASGCEHCTWLMGGCVILDGGAMRRLPSGAPDARLMLFPPGDARIIDTWTVAGLRGTGSHDIAVEDIFVPHERSFSLVTDPSLHARPLYAFPVFGLLALGIAAVTLGIARAAIDDLGELAGAKTPTYSRRVLAERATVQADVARAEAVLGSARAFVFETIDEAWTHARSAGTIDVRARARLRLAATHAAMAAARTVDLMYDAGGGTVVYASSPLQRRFRDVHVAMQHVLVAPATLELVGRILLGLEADTTML